MRVLSCIEEDGEKRVNMAHLAIIGKHSNYTGTQSFSSSFVPKHWVLNRILIGWF